MSTHETSDHDQTITLFPSPSHGFFLTQGNNNPYIQDPAEQGRWRIPQQATKLNHIIHLT